MVVAPHAFFEADAGDGRRANAFAQLGCGADGGSNARATEGGNEQPLAKKGWASIPVLAQPPGPTRPVQQTRV